MNRLERALKLHRLAKHLDRLRFDALTQARRLELDHAAASEAMSANRSSDTPLILRRTAASHMGSQ